MSFGTRLRELRIARDIQQKELAAKLNVHKGSISNWENSKRFPDEDMLNKIADLFDVSLDYLLGRTDDSNTKIYETTIDGHNYEIGIDKSYPENLSPDQVNQLILKLKEVGFDVDKLIDNIKK